MAKKSRFRLTNYKVAKVAITLFDVGVEVDSGKGLEVPMEGVLLLFYCHKGMNGINVFEKNVIRA